MNMVPRPHDPTALTNTMISKIPHHLLMIFSRYSVIAAITLPKMSGAANVPNYDTTKANKPTKNIFILLVKYLTSTLTGVLSR